MSIADKVVIISGASGGLGQTVSQVFHAAGARVVLVATTPAKVQALANQLGPDRTLSLGANLSDPAEAAQVVQATLEKFGRLDILLNLAGGFSGGQPVHQADPQEVQQMLDINLWTAYHLSRAAAEPMIKQRWGRIINVGARDALEGRAKYSAYGISKAAVLRLTESMAAELKPHNITVNAILPGAIDTAANRQAMPQADFSKWVQPATIANALLFLAGDQTAISGAAIPMYEQFS